MSSTCYRILSNPKIFDERKVPFAHLLYEIYLLNTTACIYGLAADSYVNEEINSLLDCIVACFGNMWMYVLIVWLF